MLQDIAQRILVEAVEMCQQCTLSLHLEARYKVIYSHCKYLKQDCYADRLNVYSNLVKDLLSCGD